MDCRVLNKMNIEITDKEYGHLRTMLESNLQVFYATKNDPNQLNQMLKLVSKTKEDFLSFYSEVEALYKKLKFAYLDQETSVSQNESMLSSQDRQVFAQFKNMLNLHGDENIFWATLSAVYAYASAIKETNKELSDRLFNLHARYHVHKRNVPGSASKPLEERPRTRVGLLWRDKSQSYAYHILNPCLNPETIGDTSKYEFLIIDFQISEKELSASINKE